MLSVINVANICFLFNLNCYKRLANCRKFCNQSSLSIPFILWQFFTYLQSYVCSKRFFLGKIHHAFLRDFYIVAIATGNFIGFLHSSKISWVNSASICCSVCCWIFSSLLVPHSVNFKIQNLRWSHSGNNRKNWANL